MLAVSDLVLGAVGALVVVGVLAGAAAVAWHRLRRRLRRLRSSPGVRLAMATAGSLRAGTGVHGGGPTRLRVVLWQSVVAATRAVRRTAEAGGAVADLPGLCRRLQGSAEDLDRLLVMSTGLQLPPPQVDELRRQVDEAIRASSAIRLAALASAGDLVSSRLDGLAADAEREVRCMADGIARSRAELGWR